jgi:hypothetical protein
MNLVPIWAKIFAATAIFAVFGVFVYHKTAQYEEAKLVALQAHYDSVAAKQEQKVAAIVVKQQAITEKVKNDYENKLSTVRSYYSAHGMRKSNTSSSGKLPQNAPTSGGTDAAPTDNGSIAERCAETTLQLIELQNWIKKQTEANN